MFKGRKIIFSIIVIISILVIYNIIINSNVAIVEQQVKIENLPEEFEGFTILQLTDLHGKSFGKNQQKLTKLINNQQFDVIAITGDMQNIDDTNYDALFNLIDGIEKKDMIFYTSGNHGPFFYEEETGVNSFLKSKSGEYFHELKNLTEFGKIMTEKNVKFLNKAYPIVRGENTLWLSELIYESEFDKLTNNLNTNNDIKIALTHYPISKEIYEGEYSEKIGRYDLVLAGHYHGGQWRIPILGAIYISDVNGNGWFPEKERVSGLTEWGGYKQYVSAGLGAGANSPLFAFRLFNKPEINLIKLVSS